MIGLKRHTVAVVPHDGSWGGLFEQEARTIRQAGADLVADIQHVGSTAVPDLPAKPILDIAIAVRTDTDVASLVERLEAAGYIYRGTVDRGADHLLVHESEPGVRTSHLHILCRDDPRWRDYLAFRDLLRSNEDVRRRYAELKASLAAKHANDRKAYTAAKAEFIRGRLQTLVRKSQ